MVSRINYLQTDTALAEAGSFADEMLHAGNGGSSSNTTTVRHDHVHWGSPGWVGGWGYHPYPVYSVPSGRGSNEEKRDRSWVAIPAAIIALGTLYFIGQNHAEWVQAKLGIAKLEMKAKTVSEELSHAHPALKTTVNSVFQKQRALLERIRSDAAKGLMLKVIFVSSVIATGVGGLATGGYLFAASLEPLLAYGSISSFLSAAALIYRDGFSSRDTVLKQEAQELQIAVRQAGGVLNELVRG